MTNDEKLILRMSIRYAIGRRTFSPSIVQEYMLHNVKHFSKHELEGVVRDINEANDLGMECDIQDWMEFRDILIQKINEPCKLCQQYPKDWNGDDIRCYNTHGVKGNWNCRTLNRISQLKFVENDLVYTKSREGVQHTILIQTYDILSGIIDPTPECLVMTTYKNRGHVENLQLIFDDGSVRTPTEDELVAIIKYFESAGDIK